MEYAKSSYSLKPINQKTHQQAFSGKVFTSTKQYQEFLQINKGIEPVYIKIKDYIFILSKSDDYFNNEIGMNKYQRQYLQLPLTDNISVSHYNLPIDKEFRLSQAKLELDLVQLVQEQKLELDDANFAQYLKESFANQFLKVGQILVIKFGVNTFSAKVISVQLLQIGATQDAQIKYHEDFGMIVPETDIELTQRQSTQFKLKSSGQKVQNLFRADFKFEDMGIGGLDNQLADIFRRAFASRRFPPSVLKKYGISHVKGVLLHGPPGTGKTLIARQLAKALKTKEPKIVNGPEILSKYVGESEENVRKLFKEAKEDNQMLGDESQLHIIVFDEIDAICKQRGTIQSGTGVHDSVVNQLLSMIDGVDSLNNILVIGMTNRKDLIDEAILRPGRFEVHIEVSLPDESGRQEILKIHTTQMRVNNVIGADVDLSQIAKLTKNYTGAELEAVVKSASSWAFNRVHNILDFSKQVKMEEQVLVQMQDFQKAIQEIKPQFGVDTDRFEILLRNDLIDYGDRFKKIKMLLNNSIHQTLQGKSSQLHTVLLEGDVGTGKTAIAAWAALNCEFPYVKLISPENFVGFTENGKINAIVKVFDDAYRSPVSCIVLDNIERIMEFIDIGPRFSNPILQTLLVLIKKIPKQENHRLLIIGTTTQAKILRDLEIVQCFNLLINVPRLNSPEEIMSILKIYNIEQGEASQISKKVKNIPIKQLLMILDMVASQSPKITFNDFEECYEAVTEQSL